MAYLAHVLVTADEDVRASGAGLDVDGERPPREIGQAALIVAMPRG
jgi:hypothetical protein